jgi:predicted transcriptional regulator
MVESEVVGMGGEEVMLESGMDRVNKPKRMQNTLRLATCSDLRKSIFISLQAGKKPLSELREELGVSSTTAIHALRELEKDRLVFENEKRYYALTKIGEVIALKLSDFVDAIVVLKRHEDFWLTHDLSGIPPHLLEKIGWLKDSTIAKDTATDIFKVHTSFINLLARAKKLRGVSSIFVPEYPLVLEELILSKKADVELILTKGVLEKIDEEILKKIFADKNSKFKLYITKEDAKAAFTTTDYFFSLGLFHVNGTYDYNSDLVSYDKKAIEWGQELFEWYLKRADGVYL